MKCRLKRLTLPESTGFPAAFLNLFALSLFGPTLSETDADAEEEEPLLAPLLAGEAGPPAAPRLPPDLDDDFLGRLPLGTISAMGAP